MVVSCQGNEYSENIQLHAQLYSAPPLTPHFSGQISKQFSSYVSVNVVYVREY
jgi:hypothetical protein